MSEAVTTPVPATRFTIEGAGERLPVVAEELHEALRAAGVRPTLMTLTGEELDFVLPRLNDLLPAGVQVESIVINFAGAPE